MSFIARQFPPVPPGNTLLDQGIHPRLFFTTNANSSGIQTTADLRAKLTNYYDTTPVVSYFDIVGSLNSIISEIEADMANAPDATRCNYYGVAHALMSQLLLAGSIGGSTKTPAQHGNRAADLLDALLIAAAPSLGDPAGPVSWVPFIYDWAYPYIAARPTLLANIQTTMQWWWDHAYAGYPTRPWAADTSKENALGMNMALAGAGDGNSAFNTAALAHIARYPTIISSATGVLGEQSTLSATAPDLGMIGSSGINYVNYEWPWWNMVAEAYRTAYTTQTRAAFYAQVTYQAIPSVFYGLLRSIRPYARNYPFNANGQEWFYNRGQYTEMDKDVVTTPGGMIAAFAALWNSQNPTIAGHAMWYQRERIGGGRNSEIGDPPTGYRIGTIWTPRLVLEDPTIAEVQPSSLATRGHFGDGRYEFRSGWDGNTTSNNQWVVRFWLAKWLTLGDGRGGHELNGHYDVMYQGPATMIRGSGAHGWAGHGAFNTIYFRDTLATLGSDFDTNYVFKLYGRVLGGSAPYSANRGNDLVDGSQSDFLDEVRERIASGTVDSNYVFGDMTRWHQSGVVGGWTNGNNPAITTLHHVHFVLFEFAAGQPIFVIKVHRYGTVGTRFEPCLVWNPSGDAITVNGTETANQPVRYTTGGAGHWRSLNSTRAIAQQDNTYGTLTYNNKNVMTVVQPALPQFVRAGGPHPVNGPFYNDPLLTSEHISQQNSFEAIDLYGQPWVHETGINGDEQKIAHHGVYHIQVQEQTTKTSGSLCYVNEVIPNSGGTPTTIENLTAKTNGWVGCAILATAGKRIFAYNETGDVTSGTFTVPTAGTYHMKIVNLAGTSRTISASGGATLTKLEDGSGSSGSSFTLHASQSQDFNLVCGANCVITIS